MLAQFIINASVCSISPLITVISLATDTSFQEQNSYRLHTTDNQNRLKQLVDDKAKQLDIRKEVKVGCGSDNAQAIGMNWLNFPCEVMISPILVSSTEAIQGQGFIVAHELSHIKNNDLLTIPGIGFLVALSSSIALSTLGLISFIPHVLAVVFITHIATAVFSQYREKIADQTALTICTKEEKEGAIQIFEAMQKEQLKIRNENMLGKLFISDAGEDRLDIMHPSLASRISMIQQSL